jgi:hypothetical protein
MLEEERAFYAEHRAEWLQKHDQRFVLVKGCQLVGTFDTQEQAVRMGARLFGLTSYLVRRVTESEEPIRIAVLTLFHRADHPGPT